MCGIAGFLHLNGSTADRVQIQHMTDALAHRGPDDQGIYLNDQLAFGHRRLSIIDLSPGGHQPMFSHDKKYVLIFNGEIYNFKEVKGKISNYPFSTHSDSEVILAAYEKWGSKCLAYLNGMFAFAIWDTEKKSLFIARDRLGVKPIYYYHDKGNVFAFSSEIRGLIKSGLFTARLNRHTLPEFLAYQTVHAPNTILEDVHMLMPGHYILITNKQVQVVSWWNMKDQVSNRSSGKSYKEVCKETYELLLRSVERRLIADVPLGAFLSGGIDSGAVVALMYEISPGNVKTFNISFDEAEFNEAHYARALAKKYNTDHTEIRLSPKDFLNELPNALRAMDHPSGDGPNTFVVSKATREKGITVALSGLGGDELFAGYSVFTQLKKLKENHLLENIPVMLRKWAGNAYAGIKPGIASRKIKEILSQPAFDLALTYPVSRRIYFDEELKQILHQDEKNLSSDALLPPMHIKNSIPYLSQISIFEFGTYMQNVLLRDTDQMSMAHALEVREPFLDFELVEYVLGVSDLFKNPVTPKKLLVDAMGHRLPPEIVNRKKMGFSFPWKNWLQGELRNFCEEKLKSLLDRDFINAKEVVALQKKFFGGDNNVNWIRIWLLIVLENWIEENGIQ